MNVPISTTIERMEMMMPKMNFTIPNMTSPTMQRAIYPNQATKVMRVEPTAESNLHQVCVVLMFVVICLELNLFAVPGAEGKFSFLHLFVAPFSDIFFCVFLSHRSFRFRCLSRAARLEIQGFSEKYYPTVWRFFRKPKARPFISKARCHTFAPAR